MIIKEEIPVIVEQEIIAQIKHNKLLGKIRKPKNTLFEYNVATNTLIPAQHVKSEIKGTNDKLAINDNCIYIDSLNLKNAKRKLIKGTILFHTIQINTK